MNHKEDKLQMAVAGFLDLRNVLWFHCENEGKKTPQQAYRSKQKGLKAGVPDIMIFEPRGKYVGLAVELKVGKNKPSPEQDAWLLKLAFRGWATSVCYSLEDFIKLFNHYINQDV